MTVCVSHFQRTIDNTTHITRLALRSLRGRIRKGHRWNNHTNTFMALKATIFKTELQIADMDRHYYATHALTLAQHPRKLTSA